MTRTMKDSGVEWIGEVPEQWILAKLKYNCSGFQNGSSQTQLNSDISNYPVTRIETISTGKIDFDKVGYVENINNNYVDFNKIKTVVKSLGFTSCNVISLLGSAAANNK